MERILTYTISAEYDGSSIKNFMKKQLNMSTSLITDLKASEDGICINGERKKVSDIVKEGDEIRFIMREGASENIEPVKMELDIVYEDEDVIVINKPPKVPTHISSGNFTHTVANALMFHYGSDKRQFHAVNRLDKDTSGLMCVAKHKYAHSLLSGQLERGELRRRYMALVCGDIEKDGTVSAPIARGEGILRRCVDMGGKRAVTHYRVLKRLGDYTLLELELETGRTHQIRVHMAYISHPLLGDWLYGEENKQLFERQALHSSYLTFIHPINGTRMEFEAELCEDIKKFILNKNA
ncbi:MAG: RluA family pseudouridine synthase [Clostridiales bacterium]|nr:RluA family pseudouridine synthase [Clostridiales bacterium]